MVGMNESSPISPTSPYLLLQKGFSIRSLCDIQSIPLSLHRATGYPETWRREWRIIPKFCQTKAHR